MGTTAGAGRGVGGEEAALWAAHREQGCARARAALVEQYRYLAEITVTKTVRHVPVRLERDDLVSEALVALVRAVDRFDPLRGVKFKTFAIALMRGAILEHLRREGWVPRRLRSRERAGEDVQVLSLVSLETILDGVEGYDDMLLLEQIADPAPGPEALVLAAAERETIEAALDALPEWEQALARRYYWDELTLKRIAGEIDRSESRAHQIHQRGLTRLRDWFAARPEEREMVAERRPGVGRDWTAEEDALVRELYGQQPIVVIADRLGRTPAAVSTRIWALKLAEGSAVSARMRAARAARETKRKEAVVEPVSTNGNGARLEAAVPYVQLEPEPAAAVPLALPALSHWHSELLAMDTIAGALEGLETGARERVMRWVTERLGLWK